MSEKIDLTEQKRQFATLSKEAQERLVTRWKGELRTHRSRMKAAQELGNDKAYEQLSKAASVIEGMLK